MIEHISKQLEKRPYLVRIAGLLVSILGIIWIFSQVGCLPVSQKGLRHELGPFHGRLDAQHRQTAELRAEIQGEIEKVWAALGEVAKGQQTIAEWAAATNDRLVQLERAGKITQRDLGLARSAIDNLKKQMADARSETLKKVVEVGEGVSDQIDFRAEQDREDLASHDENVREEIIKVGDGLSGSLSDEARATRKHTDRAVQRVRDDIVVNTHDLREDHKKISDAVVEERKKALQEMKQLLNIP